MMPSETFHEIERHLLEDDRPSQTLGRLHTDSAAEEANVRRFLEKCGR